jgi:hypothetical protein
MSAVQNSRLGVLVDAEGTLTIFPGDGPLNDHKIEHLTKCANVLMIKQAAARCEGCGRKVYPGDGHVCKGGSDGADS